MRTCRGHFHSAFNVLLTANISKIEVETVLLFVKLLACVDDGRLELRLPRKEIHHIDDVFHAIHIEVVHHSSLANVGFWHQKSLKFLGSGPNGNGQCALDGLQCAVQTQFAHHHKIA